MQPLPRVAFVTGGGRGIGPATAWGLGQLGITVVLGTRDPQQGAAVAAQLHAAGIAAEVLRFDVTQKSDHTAAYIYFQRLHGKLDILVNNAAVLLDWPDASTPAPNNASTISSAQLRATFEVNFFGPVALTQTLLPLLRLAPAARIVNVSSELGSLGLHTDPASPVYPNKLLAYDASKTALNAFTVHLADELRDTPIKVNSVHPGWVRTPMGGAAAVLDELEGSRSSVHYATLGADGPTGGFFHLSEAIPW